MQKYIIKTERLGLRSWNDNDITEMTALNKDEIVMEFFPSTQDKAKTQDFIKRMQIHQTEHGYCYFAADRLDTGEFIGFIGLSRQNYLTDRPAFTDIGWRLKQVAWGKGFATEGAKACLQFAFEEMNLDKVFSVCSLINIKSEKIMQKIGMQKELEFKHPVLADYPDLEVCALYVIEQPR
jgi:RimJ/RimL family protein N-acetyltransferase